MTYVKSYFKALRLFMCIMAVAFLLSESLGGSSEAIYFIYLSILGAGAGPVGLLLKKGLRA